MMQTCATHRCIYIDHKLKLRLVTSCLRSALLPAVRSRICLLAHMVASAKTCKCGTAVTKNMAVERQYLQAMLV
jgi:hypothetical protein